MQNSSQSKQPSFNINVFFTVVLIIGAYFLGSLQAKVQILKNGAFQPNTFQADVNPTQNTDPVAPQPQKAVKKPEVTVADWYRGNKNSKVVFVEYSDLECPFCQQFHPTMQRVIQEYGDQVKWIYRHFPLSFHANAQKEAEATECAGKLGGNEAFWKYTDKIFERTTSNGTGFALDQLVPLAKEIGLSETKFKTCLDTGEFAQKVKDQMTVGTAEGVTGTPGTIIIDANGDTQLVPGAIPYEQIKPMLEKALSS